MTKAGELESSIANAVKPGDTLPKDLPNWMSNVGFTPQDLIISSIQIGNKSSKHKTDVLIKLQRSQPIKISVKLSNADYFGNWYGHDRLIQEFGIGVFNKMTTRVTEWANQWLYHPKANLFVGVSISFGTRVGNTQFPFLDIFDSADELLKIIAGVGEEDSTANCLYVSDNHPSNIVDVLSNLCPINTESVKAQSDKIKIICRPVNPATEQSNRGKNVYTRFQPTHKLSTMTGIGKLKDLRELGKFIQVEPNKLNHNHILNDLENNYNIRIPRKNK